MKRIFTPREKEFIFDSWKMGVGFSEIANIMDSKPGTIFTVLRDTGGIKPRPRKTLRFATPKQVIEQCVALTD